MSDHVIELRGITKRFGSFTANADIDFDLTRGSIHAIIGENGAGKTTLMSMLYGMLRPDEGTITVDGRAVAFASPADAIASGIGMVHQHFMIAPSLTVAENIVLGRAPTKFGLLNARAGRRKVAEVSERSGLRIDPAARAGDLSVGMLQRVEIVKALYRGARVLILDEPTAVLTPQEAVELGSAMRRLAENGTSIIFISHKLREVTEMCEIATVIRRGRIIDTVPTATTSHGELSQMMVGRQVKTVERTIAPCGGREVLSLRGLVVKDDRGHTAVKGVDLTVMSGTIVGIAGVEGNGQTELMEAIAGLRRPAGGHVTLDGADATAERPSSLRRRHLAHIPEDRLARGVAGACSIRDNLILNVYKSAPYAKLGMISGRRTRQYAHDLVQQFGVACSDAEQSVASLSGGNMQKVVVARELALQPSVVLAAQPTRGVDIGAIEFIHSAIMKLRADGAGVLLVSAELEEIMALSDVIHVMYNGEIVLTVDGDRATEAELGRAMLGAHADGTSGGTMALERIGEDHV